MDLPPPFGHEWSGRVDELAVDSQALTGNVLGDPHRRPLYVYTPPGYDTGKARYPVLYLMHGGNCCEYSWMEQARANLQEALELFFEAASDAEIAERDRQPGRHHHQVLRFEARGALVGPVLAGCAIAREAATLPSPRASVTEVALLVAPPHPAGFQLVV